jgi:hypothetical protein
MVYRAINHFLMVYFEMHHYSPMVHHVINDYKRQGTIPCLKNKKKMISAKNIDNSTKMVYYNNTTRILYSL